MGINSEGNKPRREKCNFKSHFFIYQGELTTESGFNVLA